MGLPQLDPAQARIEHAFTHLLNELQKKHGFSLARLFGSKEVKPKGLYVWGAVGRGKTMLMDHFFADLEIPRRRVHFHAFMQEVHKQRTAAKSDDVIGEIAQGFSGYRLLCLDEMQVVDIADAMILGRLFEALWARGVVIVTTSNQPPDGLYQDGLNRQLFVPFVERLKAMMKVLHLADGTDYRLGRLAADEVYVTPLGHEAEVALNALWAKLSDGEIGKRVELPLLGRQLVVPRAARGCAWFGFSDLVEQPLAAPDYLAIAQNFKTVFISDVRVFAPSERNEAKRFILLIDTLYDAGRRVVISAEDSPEKLYPKGQHKPEFARTVSRLLEMQSRDWWTRAF